MKPEDKAKVQQALTWMDEIHPGNMTPMAEEAWDKSRAALRQLLEQPAPVQEPANQRSHEMALRQWEHWKQYALELQERLVKYEGGSPMRLNTTPPAAQPADHGDELTIAYLDGVHTGQKMKREWVGLTDEEIDELYETHHNEYGYPLTLSGYERAIEAKLREKNGGAA